MAALADHAIEATDDRLAARNALILAAAQALAGGNNTVIVATGGIAGSMLAPSPMLATLPISTMVLGMWIGTLPVGMLAKAFGRRFALQLGCAFGALSGVVSCMAMLSGSFALLLAGALCGGLYASAHQSYRFAAADTASVQFRAKAVAWVLAGGVLAAVLGPQIVIFTENIWPSYLFAGTYLTQSVCAIIAAGVLTQFKSPRPARSQTFTDGQPLLDIICRPQFIIAATCGVASYVMMNVIMTAAPLAIVMCHHSVSDAALGIQWHVIGMYAPSFFTGALILRFGLRTIMAVGLGLIFAAASIGILGVALWNFWLALALLGVGWNFAFIGATTLVTECHGPRERNKVQAFNDFVIFGAMAIGSFSSGALLAGYGWGAVNALVFPVVLTAAILLTWGALARRPNPI
ncbi:MAG: MFS transporter [Hyphomicrobiales bacterium]|nr:MFS transporter [Hyphomicrobiales bacterium]MDE2284582.1 MFS transporter [Hyphomicrobiales bacterium]